MTDKGRGLMQFCHRKPQDVIGKYTYQQILDYGEETIRNLNESNVIKPGKSSYNVEVHKQPRLTPMADKETDKEKQEREAEIKRRKEENERDGAFRNAIRKADIDANGFNR